MRPLLSFLSGVVLLGSFSLAQTTADYPLLDHVGGTLVTTNAAPIRPMVWDGSSTLWAVNTSLGTIERFDVSGSPPFDEDPAEVVRVPWAPVSIGLWTDGGDEHLVVACRNSWGVLVLDAATTQYERWIPLPAEPTDLVVDSDADAAWVSCMGADAVVRIHLTDGSTTRYDEASTGTLRIKSPFFLGLESDGRVLVTPLHSGNNTTVSPDTGGLVSLDGATAGLPDADLFRIDPAVQLTASVTVISTAVGTSLFGHGRNPHDGTLWVLNTDARNADAAGEPALGFDLVDTRAAVLSSSHVNGDPPASQWILDGDGTGFSTSTAVGQGFVLAFHPSESWACIAGLLTDNVVIVDDGGELLEEIELPEGAIPRGLSFRPSTEQLFVHCWGTSEVLVYTITDSAGPNVSAAGELRLSHDPLPEQLRLGRELFFDGHNSARQNISCATCHLEGGTDFLAWDLSGLPFDHKGAMVTQTLVGLERVSPFHWRGERTLEDFNTFAFPNLLGGQSLDTTDFEAFEAYLMSLRNPANPFQDRTRKVTSEVSLSSIDPCGDDFGDGNAIAGMGHFQDEVAFEARWRCVECHSFPVGTNNDVFAVFPNSTAPGEGFAAVTPEHTHFKNAPFHELWRKKASLVCVQEQGSPSTLLRSFLGFGTRHDGITGDVLRFFLSVTPVDGTPTAEVFAEDVSAFLQQWDQGMGQAVHFAYLANGRTTEAEDELEYLMSQASRPSAASVPNCDVCVFGTVPGTTTRASWVLDRSIAGTGAIGLDDPVFVENKDSGASVLSVDDFLDEQKPALFVGLPFGMAERFAVDADMDGIRDASESSGQLFVPNANGSDITAPDIDTNELLWITTNSARLLVETDEPTTLSVEYGESSPGSPTEKITSPLLSRVHLVMLRGLRPSTEFRGDSIVGESVTYDYTVTATDLAANSTAAATETTPATDTFSLPTSTGGNGTDFDVLRNEHIVDVAPSMTLQAPSSGVVSGALTLSARNKQGESPADPAPDRFFVVRLFRKAGGTGALTKISSDQLRGTNTADAAITVRIASGGQTSNLAPAGPYVVNKNGTNANGDVTLNFKLLSPVTSGDTIVACVEAVVRGTGTSTSHTDGGPGDGTTGRGFSRYDGGGLPPPPSGGQGTPPWLVLNINVATLDAFAQWDFPRTTEHRFTVEATVP